MARKKKAARPFRSKFETMLGRLLDGIGIPFGYETETFKITVPVRGCFCEVCGETDVRRNTRYTPDFFLPRYVVEAKGRFTANDRKRVLALLKSHDWRAKSKGRKFAMLFMRDNTLSKASKTRYSDWCNENGVEFAIKAFNGAWLSK